MTTGHPSEASATDVRELLAQAQTAFERDDIDQARGILLQASSIAERSEDLPGLAAVKLKHGIVERHVGEYAESLRLLTESLTINEQLDDAAGIARTCSYLGLVFKAVGQYAGALDYLLRALDLHTELEDHEGVAQTTANIGKIHEATGDFEHALDYLRRSTDIYRTLGNSMMVGFMLGSLGSVHANAGNLSLAIERYTEALQLFEEAESGEGIAIACMFIASTLLDQDDVSGARTFLDRADSVNLVDPRMIIEREETRAGILTAENDLEGAQATLQKMLDLSIQIGARQNESEAHMKLRDLARKRGDLDAYVEHNDAYLALKERLAGADTQRQVALQTKERELAVERQKREQERAILYSTLPRHVADRVLRGETVSGDHFDEATVLFLDVVGFTEMSSHIPPGHVVRLLDVIFSRCDLVCNRHGLTKIKTIGDSYMAVAGVPESLDDHALKAVQAAVDLLTELRTLEISMPANLGDTSWVNDIDEIDVRIGLHCGPVVAGIIGSDRMQYDVWGDTVNVASRMESTGQPGQIQISNDLAILLDHNAWELVPRDPIQIKGKGLMHTFWVTGPM